MADKNAGHSFDFDPFNPPPTTTVTATATPHRSPPRQLASGQTRPIEHISQQRRSPVRPGDPNLDPFYLERALERESHVRDQFDQPFTSSPVRYDHRGNVPPLSLTRSQPPETPSHAPSGVQHRGFESARSRYPPSGARAAPASCSQSSCSSLQSDATTLTPDLTPSSSFSSTCSVQNYLEDVWKATEPLTLHDRSPPPQRSPTATSNAASHQLYLPLTPSDDQPDPWTSSTTVQMSTPRLRSANTSSETLTMDPKPDSSPPPPLPPPPPPSPAYLHSKPLPCLPSSSPSMATLAPLTPPKKVFSSGSRSQIDPTSISSPILLNPVTLEPHSSHLDCAFFIPANGYPSVAAKAAATDPEATPPPTAQSRASTLTSNVNGEQSVWESDSDSGSVAPRSQSRRTPIETLRKVRSRVQLRRAAKSEDKLTATEPSNDGSTQEKVPALPPLDPRVSNGLPPPAKQTAPRLTPSSSLHSPPPSSSSRKGGDRSGDEVNTFTAAAVHAKTRRRHRVDGPLDDPSSPSSKDENCDGYSHSHSHNTSDQAADLTLARPGMFKRVWGSLQTLNCQSNRMTRKPSYRKTL